MSCCHEIPPSEWQEAKGEADPSFSDLSAYLDGTAVQEIPTVAEAWPGQCIFYAGRLNEIHAEPGVGKTNIIMTASILTLEAGGSVLYIDPEDTPKGFTTRMLMLGASPEDIRSRVFYLHNPEPIEILTAQAWARRNKPTIVALDGLAEAMAAQGINEDKAQDVLPFFRSTVRPFAEAGAAVVIADHVAKSSESRGQFARGSGAKAGRYDGASYDIVAAIPYTPRQAGYVKLKIAKDRCGGVGPRGKIVAELHFSPGNGRTLVEWREPEERAEGETFRPTAIMGKIIDHLKVYGEATKSSVSDAIGSKKKTVLHAIELLIKEGALTVTLKGQSHILKIKEAAN